MRSLWNTLDRQLRRDIGAVGLAIGVVGASFGAIAVAAGQSPWIPLTMSATVFAGGAQFTALGIAAGGGTAAAAVLAGLILNARLLVFGLSIADVLQTGWRARLLGSHLLVDQAAAFTQAERDPLRRRAAYLGCGVLLYLTWNLGTLLGVLAGRAIGDPRALGLDAAEPMVFLALVLPALREAPARRCALAGAALALATAPFLPAGLPVLLGLLGLVAARHTSTEPVADAGTEPVADTRADPPTVRSTDAAPAPRTADDA
ncbi:AzlC family ABC transporter permease [Streptomyces orinoci]|uniref:AzlC family ABC transporter permease n=1 Tax=Streptomyces orinoci TaxID=67339 RepID=A0ABV3K418_STRON|nr:AzlC family ABC transporter permease [Streptomyces orinoci]